MGRATFHKAGRQKRFHVIETLTAMLQKEPSIVFAFLYGSFLSEPVFRDIDIGVFLAFDNPSDYLNVELDLSRKIEDALGSEFPVEVKVVNHAPLAFRYSVVRGKLLFSENDNILVDFMTSAARKYLDFAPLRHRYIKEAMATDA